MSGNNGGPWGGSGSGGGDDDKRGDEKRAGSKRPGEGSQMPEIDELMKKGQEQLRVLMGGRGGGNRGNGAAPGPMITPRGVGLAALAAVAVWVYASFYTVRPEERSIELMFGSYYKTGNPGLNFAPWPIVTAEILQVTGERTLLVGEAADEIDHEHRRSTTEADP